MQRKNWMIVALTLVLTLIFSSCSNYLTSKDDFYGGDVVDAEMLSSIAESVFESDEALRPDEDTSTDESATATPDMPSDEEDGTVVVLNVLEYATAHGFTVDGNDATKCKEWKIDENITVTISGGQNSGKVFSDGVRLYVTDSPAGSLTVKSAEGFVIKSIRFTLAEGAYAHLQLNGNTVDSGISVGIDADSATFNAVKNGVDGKQIRISEIEVIYKAVEIDEVPSGDPEDVTTEVDPSEDPTEENTEELTTEEETTEEETTEEETTEREHDGVYYWTETGTKYHKWSDCGHLKNSTKIFQGTLLEAKTEKKGGLCSSCALK